jgi:uncharacterized linocin/CFP29 family protein
MNGILKRELAPVSDAAWKMIDDEAARTLKGNLSARALVNFSGPHGLAAAAVNLGGVEPAAAEVVKGVAWGTRQVLPLVEVCLPFSLSLVDLDQVPRGGVAPDLAAVKAAAQKAALFEEKALYYGLPGGYAGLLSASSHKAIPLPSDAAAFLATVETAVHALQSCGIAGPYHLVLGRKPYQALAVGDGHGYPLSKRVAGLLEGGSVRWSPALEGGALVSGRGNDYELTVGQDYAIGYAGSADDLVNLYLMASFAFRVIEPAAAVELKAKA